MMRSMGRGERECIGGIPEARARARAQLLHRPRSAPPADVVHHLLALQAQALRSARLALRVRGAAAGLEGLVRTWLMRGTLHLVRAEDLPWLHALFAPRQVRANERRLAQLGVSPADAEPLLERLGEEGALTRAELSAA